MLLNKKAFTLVEVMVSLILAAIVVFFSYTMMISSYNLYRKMISVSKNSNDIRFAQAMLKNSIMYAETIDVNSGYISFKRYDMNKKAWITDKYTLDGASFQQEPAWKNYTVNPETIPNSSVNATLILSNSSLLHPIVVLSNVKAIYYKIDRTGIFANSLKDITLGIVFDNVLSNGTKKKEGRSFCFTVRGVRSL